jgi:hypothetical protein
MKLRTRRELLICAEGRTTIPEADSQFLNIAILLTQREFPAALRDRRIGVGGDFYCLPSLAGLTLMNSLSHL